MTVDIVSSLFYLRLLPSSLAFSAIGIAAWELLARWTFVSHLPASSLPEGALFLQESSPSFYKSIACKTGL